MITGCTKHPAPGNKFCPEHQGYQSPVLLPSQVSKETRDKLNKQQRMRSELDVDMLFIVESILDKSGEEILVKWENYKQPTWEPLSSMPAFIKSYVENNGCGNIPDPIIKHVKTVDGNKHVMLEWTDNAGDKDVMWQKMTVSEFEDEFKCDTKKDKDKRLCRHSFGINIGCYPCGVVVMFKVVSCAAAINPIFLFVHFRSSLVLKVYLRYMLRLQSGWQPFLKINFVRSNGCFMTTCVILV